MSRRCTFSKASLLTICGWWARDDVSYPAEETTREATLGNDAHAANAATINGEPLPALSDEARALYRQWLTGWWEPRKHHGWRAEVAYALNPFTSEARELTLPGPRQYPDLGPEWLCGTADAVLVGDSAVMVDDFKTGRHAPSAHGNGQLLSLALAAATVHGISRALVAITSVRPERLTASVVPLDRYELDTWRDTLAQAVARVPTAEPNPGPHCDELWCPARQACPATPVNELVELKPKRKKAS